MTQIDIFSGFLGAGKTTLIRKLIQEAYQGEKLVLIENEFGDIAIDGGFLQDAGIQITEMNSGCICCTLVGDFTKALKQVIEEYAPDRILIEPSGVGKLSDVAAAVARIENATIGAKVTVVDAGKAKMYARNFGEFFDDQVKSADLIVMSRTDTVGEKKLLEAVELLKTMNPEAGLITTPWHELNGCQILDAMQKNGLRAELDAMKEEHGHHHHHHDDDDGHGHGHHHHHADEVFGSWGTETARCFSECELREKLQALSDEERYGSVLRAKGIVNASDGDWLYFDYVPEEIDIRRGSAAVTGRLCVIGAHIREDALKELFNIG